MCSVLAALVQHSCSGGHDIGAINWSRRMEALAEIDGHRHGGAGVPRSYHKIGETTMADDVCWQEAPGGARCTMAKGHEGDHVAESGRAANVIDTWCGNATTGTDTNDG